MYYPGVCTIQECVLSQVLTELDCIEDKELFLLSLSVGKTLLLQEIHLAALAVKS